MQAFVHSRNQTIRKDDASTLVNDMHDLKVPVPSLDVLESAYLPSVQGAALHKAMTSKSQGSSARGRQSNAFTRYLSPEDAESFNDINDLDTSFNVLSEDEVEKLKQTKLAEMQSMSSIDKYIEGDSYPDTTSGRLTDVDNAEIQATIDPVAERPRPQINEFRMAPPPKRTKSQQQQLLDKTSSKVKEAAPRATHRSTERSHGKSKPTQSEVHHANVDTFQDNNELFSRRQDIATLEPQFRASTPRRSHGKKRPAANKEAKPQAARMQPSNAQAAYAALDDATLSATDVEAMTASYWPTKGRDHHTSDAVAQQVSQQEDHRLALDFDEEELFELQYEQLKTQAYDNDPRATDIGLPEIHLDLKSDLSLEAWAAHFETLDIDKWEDAGDWFVTQFSDVMSRMKSVRRAKRAIAQQLEQEIDERHNTIVKKRIIIGDTMQEMRTHGIQVLDQH